MRNIASNYALIDLHIHLDGSISPQMISRLATINRVHLPVSSIKELESRYLVCPKECIDLNDYLKCFELPCKVLQNKRAFEDVIGELLKELDDEGLVYAEIRFAPQLHTHGGMSQEEVVIAATNGLHKALSQTRLKAKLILCCMRGDDNLQENLETVRLASKYEADGIAACDLAGAEAIYPTEAFEDVFLYASELGVPFTIHSGEAAGADSVRCAVDMGASRIGHGIRCHDDDDTCKLLVAKNITLELCPTSNINTQALQDVTEIRQYPLQDFLDRGVKVTINTDNTTVSSTSLKKEFTKLFEEGIIDTNIAHQLVLNAADAAFLSETEREYVVRTCLARMNGECI